MPGDNSERWTANGAINSLAAGLVIGEVGRFSTLDKKWNVLYTIDIEICELRL
jgi:hypothetical protein